MRGRALSATMSSGSTIRTSTRAVMASTASRGPRPWQRRVMNKPHRMVLSGAIPSHHDDGSFARSSGSRCL